MCVHSLPRKCDEMNQSFHGKPDSLLHPTYPAFLENVHLESHVSVFFISATKHHFLTRDEGSTYIKTGEEVLLVNWGSSFLSDTEFVTTGLNFCLGC